MTAAPCALKASQSHHGPLRCAAVCTSAMRAAPLGFLSYPRSLHFPLFNKGVVSEKTWCRGFCAENLNLDSNSRAPWPSRAANRSAALALRQRYRELVVTTNWEDVGIAELRALLTATEQNCDQFPKLNPDGSLPQVNPVKLQRAVQHSFIVVAMYIRGQLEEDYFRDRPEEDNSPQEKRTLVAFGRTTSDRALTASIHDLAVAPSLQGQGIGRRLMQRLVREISRYGISDISVMASSDTRPFFRACGFGADILGSTAMMYTAPEACEASMALLVPPSLQESWMHNAREACRKEIVKNVTPA